MAAKLGSGARFASLKAQLAVKKGVTDPGALAAYIGRKKYGNKKMASLAGHGKKVAATMKGD
jgi:hypothetical protein